MSEIRTLLANAQSAELRGEREDAARLLRLAAEWYRDRQQLKRAAQMLRQARRVEGVEDQDAVFGFGEEFEEEAVPEVARPREGVKELVEQRGPQLADPALDAWCSFCCRPKAEVGVLVAGPAGAFVCAACTVTSRALLPSSGLGDPPAVAPSSAPGGVTPVLKVMEATLAFAPSSAPHPDPLPAGAGRGSFDRSSSSQGEGVRVLPHELPAQRRARERFMRLRGRLSLVIGPEGTGKSAWLATLRSPDIRQVELDARLTAEDERDLLTWLEAPGRLVFLVVRGDVPPPALVLQGEHGPEPIHDTATLAGAVPHLTSALVAKLDAVYSFEPPGEPALIALAHELARARNLVLPEAAVSELVRVALRTRRGVHELVTLLARIPPGTYAL